MSNEHPSVPFQRSQSADFAFPQPRLGLLMTHSSGTLPTMDSPVSFQRRTFENARHLRDSLNSAIRQIEPLVETARTVQQNAISISNFLHRPQSDITSPMENVNGDGSVSTNYHNPGNTTNHVNYVTINLEGPSTSNTENVGMNQENLNLHSHAAIYLNNSGGGGQNNNNADVDSLADRGPNPIEAQQAVQVLLKYVPFVFILLAKAVYDYHEGIFILIIMFATFAHANNVVKHEALKRARRSLWALSIELVYICACIIFIHYVFSDDLHDFNMVLNLVLIRTFTHPLTVWNLLWIVSITDFTLKLITVTVKIFLTMLPGHIVAFKKRSTWTYIVSIGCASASIFLLQITSTYFGKIYLFIEAISQLYRSIATIQPWLYYLLESYQGPEKIVAVFLSAFYMISKGSDLMFKVRLLKTAFWKLLQTVTIGSSPSKEQIQTAGDHCPICHDNYDSPVLLQCRHIFCESCVSTWFDREQTCPLCRAKIVDDPSWRDGSTSFFIQLF